MSRAYGGGVEAQEREVIVVADRRLRAAEERVEDDNEK